MSLEDVQRMRIEDIVEERPLFSEADRVSRAIGYFRESQEYEAFLIKEEKLSMATVRDLLTVKFPISERLGNLATYAPELRKTDDIGKAARLMLDYRLRALPSFQSDGRAMAVSARGIIRNVSERVNSHLKASSIMTPSPVTIGYDENALKAKEVMMRRSFDHLPVIRDGKLEGILTSSQLIFHLLPEERQPEHSLSGRMQVRFDYAVGKIADESVPQIGPDAGLSEVIRAFLRKKASCVIVTLWDEIQGIITLRDVMKPLVRREKSRTPFYIVGLPNEPFEAEAARMKFERLADLLSRSFPSIEEVRAVIKERGARGGRRRSEVSISIYTPRASYSYAESGYELSEVFDTLAPKLKRLLSSKQSRVTRTQGESLRKVERPG